MLMIKTPKKLSRSLMEKSSKVETSEFRSSKAFHKDLENSINSINLINSKEKTTIKINQNIKAHSKKEMITRIMAKKKIIMVRKEVEINSKLKSQIEIGLQSRVLPYMSETWTTTLKIPLSKNSLMAVPAWRKFGSSMTLKIDPKASDSPSSKLHPMPKRLLTT